MKIFNKKLNKKIQQELEYLNSKFFIFDKPVPFKEGLELFPVMLEDHDEFLKCSSICTLNKNDIEQGILMSNLDFLIHLLVNSEQKQMYLIYLSRLFEIVFRAQNGVYCKKCHKVLPFQEFFDNIQKNPDYICEHCGNNEFGETLKYDYSPTNKHSKLYFKGIEITAKDFDRFRQIIMYQNLPTYKDDSWVHAEVRKDQAEKQRLLNNGKKISASLENKIVCVAAKSSYKIEELYGLSMRKFVMLLTAIDDAMTYETSRIGMMSGMVKFKNPLEHWIYKNEETLYEKGTSTEEMTKKLTS